MMNLDAIKVQSEIGTLKKVLIQRPGKELENLMPEYIDRLLFDDIPYLKIAQEEHDSLADIARKNGAEVVYLNDLTAESIIDEQVRDSLISEYIYEAGILEESITQELKEFFKSMPNRDMISKMIEGIRKNDIKNYNKRHLKDYLDDSYPFIIDPIPNIYFSRDPFCTIGKGVCINKMFSVTRNRETLFAKYIFKYHPDYKDVPVVYNRDYQSSIEGGDVLVLSPELLAVGVSQRTQPRSIELLAKRVLKDDIGFKKVLAIDIPKTRSFMHLDTVFTMVDKDKFTIHPNIKNDLKVMSLELKDDKNLKISEDNDNLENILKKNLNLDKVTLIKCGGDSIIDAAREQWNDGSNTFAIAPGRVIAYSRNYVTNKIMEDAGIEVLTIPSSELSRGRGGPRCMTMPLLRESI